MDGLRISLGVIWLLKFRGTLLLNIQFTNAIIYP